MAILNDGINAPAITGTPTAAAGSLGFAEPSVEVNTIELVSALTVDDILARVRNGELDAETVVAAERRGKQRAGVLARLT